MLNHCPPLVSVGISCFNQEKYIGEAIDSILQQDYSNFEIIISDDASTDDSFKIIATYYEKYKNDFKIRIHKNKSNLGIGGNRNKIFELSHGEFFLIADGDDISLPHRITALIESITKDHNIKLITSDAYEMSLQGKILRTKKVLRISQQISITEYFEKPPLFWGACNLIHRSLYDAFGPFMKNVGADDQIMLLRCLLLGNAKSISEPLVKHRLGGVGDRKSKDLDSKLKKLRKDIPTTISDYIQMIEDSKKFNNDNIVKRYLSKKLSTAIYVAKVLNIRIEPQTIMNLYNPSLVPLTKKINIYLMVKIKFFHWLKYQIKSFKR